MENAPAIVASGSSLSRSNNLGSRLPRKQDIYIPTYQLAVILMH
jgi:hypothetical protein